MSLNKILYALAFVLLIASFLLLIFVDTSPTYGEINKVEAIQPVGYKNVVEKQIDIVEEFVPMETGASDEEIELLALVTVAEAEGESEEGKRLVIDTVLNRVDSERFPNTIHDVVYQKNQFTSMWNGRTKRCVVTDEIRQLVISELTQRTNYDVLYFRTKYYHGFGRPIMTVGNHYFSGI